MANDINLAVTFAVIELDSDLNGLHQGMIGRNSLGADEALNIHWQGINYNTIKKWDNALVISSSTIIYMYE